jgi:hypothetical protein
MKVPVISKQDARAMNHMLMRRGGANQEEFLAQVGASSLTESVPPTLSLLVLMGLGEGSFAIKIRAPESAAPANCSEGQLELQECACHTHGHVILHLPGSGPILQGEVRTKLEACRLLEGLYFRDLPDQPEFEEAVRTASFLSGEMPFKV